MFLAGTVSFLVAFAVLGQDNKDEFTAESVKDFTVRILSIGNNNNNNNNNLEFILRSFHEEMINCALEQCI